MEIGLTLGGGGPTASTRHSHDDPTLREEASLVVSVARGDAGALEQLYTRYAQAVYSLALRLLTDAPAAEEVVQETFLKLWRQPSAYQPERGRLGSWLLGVAHHHAIDLLRRRQLEQRRRVSAPPPQNGDALVDLLDTLGIASTEGDPQAGAGAHEQRAAVTRALGSLPAEQRVPLELAYYTGLTQQEIATLLDLPLGTIKTRIRLGLQQLRRAPDLAQLWGDR